MNISLPLALILAVAVTTSAAAQRKKESSEEMGTPEQRAACAPDVRRFCHKLKSDDGPFAYLNCLQEHREKLHTSCVRVIDGGTP